MQETPVWFLGREDPLEKEYANHSRILGLPLWLSWERICLQCGRPGFDPWVGKIPWRRERLPTPVLWPGEFHGLGCKELDRTERLSLSLFKIMRVRWRIFGPITAYSSLWFIFGQPVSENGILVLLLLFYFLKLIHLTFHRITTNNLIMYFL